MDYKELVEALADELLEKIVDLNDPEYIKNMPTDRLERARRGVDRSMKHNFWKNPEKSDEMRAVHDKLYGEELKRPDSTENRERGPFRSLHYVPTRTKGNEDNEV